MKICVLCSGYPTPKSAANVFVAKLCDEFAELGHNVTVIAPQSISNTLIRNGQNSPSYFEHKTRSGHIVRVFRPHIVSFGTIFLLNKLNSPLRNLVIRSVLREIGEQDVYYGHFWFNAYSLYRAIKDTGKPLFVATGESIINFRTKDIAFKEYIKGVICVSTKNKEESISCKLTTDEKCIIIPNAIDNSVFQKMDKQKCREELGIASNLFVVIYVGQINRRKGFDRLAAAIDSINDPQIGVVFLGRVMEGKKPQCKGIVKLGFAGQEEIVKYLNASDVFVLPTRAEGCCNAIIEAMACGLPIISSDLPFNYDVLDNQNSILIDPDNVEQIASAIERIKNNVEMMKSLANCSLKRARSLTLSNRASRIINFINERK